MRPGQCWGTLLGTLLGTLPGGFLALIASDCPLPLSHSLTASTASAGTESLEDCGEGRELSRPQP